MSVIKDFVLSKGGELGAQQTTTNTNTNNISISVSSDQAGSQQAHPVVGQPYIAPQSINFTQAPTSTPMQVSQIPNQSTSTTPDNCEVQYQSTFPQEAQVVVPEEVQQRVTNLENELEFYKILAKILSDILKTNNPKLIANVIDRSGKVIVEAPDLVRLVAVKTHVDVGEINLRYTDEEESGCLAKATRIKEISDIKIRNVSFNLAFNAEYNILKDDYNISLNKVVMPIQYSR